MLLQIDFVFLCHRVLLVNKKIAAPFTQFFFFNRNQTKMSHTMKKISTPINEKHDNSFQAVFLKSMIAGFANSICMILTNPLDVLKIRFQMQGLSNNNSKMAILFNAVIDFPLIHFFNYRIFSFVQYFEKFQLESTKSKRSDHLFFFFLI